MAWVNYFFIQQTDLWGEVQCLFWKYLQACRYLDVKKKKKVQIMCYILIKFDRLMLQKGISSLITPTQIFTTNIYTLKCVNMSALLNVCVIESGGWG